MMAPYFSYYKGEFDFDLSNFILGVKLDKKNSNSNHVYLYGFHTERPSDLTNHEVSWIHFGVVSSI
jgi:hypothetical protein